MFPYKNSTNFLKELQKANGCLLYENEIKFLSNLEKKMLTYTMSLLFFAIVHFSYSVTLVYNFILFASVLIIFLNYLIIRVCKLKLRRILRLFTDMCSTIIKFENVSKVMLKVSQENNIQNEMGELVKCLSSLLGIQAENSQTAHPFQVYMKLKLESYKKAFKLFEIFFCSQKWFVNIVIQEDLIDFLEKITLSYESTLKNLRKNDTTENMEAIVAKINSNHKPRADHEYVYAEQISDLIISNRNIIKEYHELIDIICRSDSNQTRLHEKMDKVVEMQQSALNALKQIRSNMCQNNLDHKEEDNFKEELRNGNQDLNLKCSIYELEYNNSNINAKAGDNQNEKRLNAINTISLYEIMERENETKELQMNLIEDLDRFLNNKDKNNPKVI